MNLNKKTLSEQIYQILKGDILTRNFLPGQKLTLRELQERFQVSSTPVRDALTRLSDEGLVEYYSNIGVNVVSLNREDLRELYEFMADLDSLAIFHASFHPDQKDLLSRLKENILVSEKYSRKKHLADAEQTHWQALSDEFHLIFYEFCQNKRMCRTAERQRGQLTIFSNQYSTITSVLTSIESEHKKIYEAYEKGDVLETMRLMRDHLMHSMEFALTIIEA